MMGTGSFAVPTFESLLDSHHEVAVLVTRPTPPVRSRGKPPRNPMREVAEARGIEVLSPDDVNSETARKQLASLRPGATRESAQVSTITFNQPLLRDVEMIVAAQEEKVGQGGIFGIGRSNAPLARLGRHRFHLIDAGRHTSSLSADSKGTPERNMLAQLFRAGRTETARWLERHHRDIAKRQTVDLRQRYLEHGRDRLASPTAQAVADEGEPGSRSPSPFGPEMK